MNLIIVESPTKARTLGRFLGKEYSVDSTMGHVRDLPKSKLGIDIEHDFKPEYVLLAKKKDTVGRIREEAKEADKVYLATDPDREGEAIAYHVAELLRDNSKLLRIVFHEITEQAVKRALEHPTNINLQLVDAQQARRVLDRLVGYKLSPLLWKKVRRGLSAGRVQSVAVRLIVEREREIEAFRPEEYWEVYCEVKSEKQKEKGETETFVIKLAGKDGEKIKIDDKDEAEKVVTDLEKSVYTVSLINKREVHKSPYPPFTTSTMAQAASRLYFWSAKKTMSIAQKLYEEGLITYHRTDSTNLSEQAIKMALLYIKEKYGERFLPEKPRIYKTKSKVAQEAHEAVRPTDIRQMENGKWKMENRLGRDAELLYSLIWKRFAACQMTKAVYDETTIDVSAKCLPAQAGTLQSVQYLLRASGQIMKFEGWRVVYGNTQNAKRKTDETTPVQLPEVEQGQPLQLIKVDPQQKFTEPPARYTEASLVKTLEKLGIGRPSTYAPTISTIQDRQYVEKNEGKFQPTFLGNAANDFLLGYFPDVFDYKFTAHMEGNLDEIANGEKEWVPVVDKFWKPFSDKLEKVEDVAKRVKIEVEKTGDKCPKCSQGDQVIRIGKFGKFLSCSRFPECKWSANYAEKIQVKCPGCGQGDVIIRKTKRGKRFYGCSRYPDCKWASWRKPG